MTPGRGLVLFYEGEGKVISPCRGPYPDNLPCRRVQLGSDYYRRNYVKCMFRAQNVTSRRGLITRE